MENYGLDFARKRTTFYPQNHDQMKFLSSIMESGLGADMESPLRSALLTA
jgi:hypothetical protein